MSMKMNCQHTPLELTIHITWCTECGAIKGNLGVWTLPKSSETKTHTFREVMQILKNFGVDINCGACMEIAYTGVTTNTHECSRTSLLHDINEVCKKHGA